VNDSILGLAYLVFEVTDPDAWHALLVDCLGATEGATSAADTRAYRLDGRAARIFVARGAADDLVALGFEARSRSAMWDVAMRARDEGAFVEECFDAHARGRHAKELVRFDEPAGLEIEVGYGFADDATPLDTTRCEQGFVLGEQGLGHVALGAEDVNASRRFFETVLGFRLSDEIRCELRGGYSVDVTFLHVNPRHHTVALARGLTKHLHHFMVQPRSLDDLGRIYDRCFDRGVAITKTLGRHPNDRMLSFYGTTPSGFEFECGYGGVEIDDASWVPTVHDRISTWGHRAPGKMRDLHRPTQETAR